MSTNMRPIGAALNPDGQYRKGRHYGVEIELEYANHAFLENVAELTRNQWRLTHDGSLREGGIELVSEPMTVDSLKRQLLVPYERIRPRMSTARTGIHVHANVQDLTVAQIGNLMALYLVVEPLLFDFVGAEREFSNYCLPWYDCREALTAARGQLAGPRYSTNMTLRWARESCKYSALNFTPLRNLGTVEFRHAPTFQSVEQTIGWLECVDHLVRTSLEFKSIPDVWEMANTGLDELLSRSLSFYSASMLDEFDRRINETDSVGALLAFMKGKPDVVPRRVGSWDFRPDVREPIAEPEPDDEGITITTNTNTEGPWQVEADFGDLVEDED